MSVYCVQCVGLPPASLLFLPVPVTGTVLTEGKSRARPAMIRIGTRRVDMSKPPVLVSTSP